MRPSLLPGLIAAAQRNADRGIGDVALFEVRHSIRATSREDQRRVAAGIRRGTAKLDWRGPSLVGRGRSRSTCSTPRPMRLPRWKPAASMSPRCRSTNGGPDWYHPGPLGQIKLGPKLVLATFGEFHPMTLEALDATGPMSGFEVFLDAAARAEEAGQPAPSRSWNSPACRR